MTRLTGLPERSPPAPPISAIPAAGGVRRACTAARSWGSARDRAVVRGPGPGDGRGRRRARTPESPAGRRRPQAPPPGPRDDDTRPDLRRRRLSPGSTPPMTTNPESEGGVIPRSFTIRPPVDRGRADLVPPSSGLSAAHPRGPRAAAPASQRPPALPARRARQTRCTQASPYAAPSPRTGPVPGVRCALWVGRGSMAPASPPPREHARSTARAFPV